MGKRKYYKPKAKNTSEAQSYLNKSKKVNSRNAQKGKSVRTAGGSAEAKRRWMDWRETDGQEYPVTVMKASELDKAK